MTGRVCLVTGALGALGTPLCAALAKQGATVVLGARDEARGKAAAEALRASSGNPDIHWAAGDLGSLASVRAMAEDVKARFPRLHVLVNNAAIFSATRKTTADGHESMFGINYLAPFLLTNLLLDTLKASAPARIVFVTMDNKGPLKLDDLESERSFDKIASLGHSKGSCGAITQVFARRLAGTGVTVNCVNPDMTRTTLIREAPWWLKLLFSVAGQSPEKGAAGLVLLASSPELETVTGQMYHKVKQVPFPAATADAAAGERLWTESARLVGLAG